MALTAMVMFAGVAVLFGSIGASILLLLGTGVLLAYIKIFEEKEKVMQFDQEYLEYKCRTPFLTPRFGKRN